MPSGNGPGQGGGSPGAGGGGRGGGSNSGSHGGANSGSGDAHAGNNSRGGNRGEGSGSDHKRVNPWAKYMDWARGPGTTVKVKGRRGTKGRDETRDSTRTTYQKNYVPAVAAKTKYEPKIYAGGSNVLDREKTSYKDSMVSRADDARNWEHYYKAPKAGSSALKYSTARVKAERKAREVGKAVYDVKRIEHNTARIKADSKQAGADSAASGRGKFGSTQVAQGVVASRQLANRRSQRGRGRSAEAFADPKGAVA